MKKLFLILSLLTIGSFCFAKTITTVKIEFQTNIRTLSAQVESTIKKYVEEGYKLIDHIDFEKNGYTEAIILIFEK